VGKGETEKGNQSDTQKTRDKDTIHESSPPRDNNVTIHQQTHGQGFVISTVTDSPDRVRP
jgi:hypothetical protein